MSIRSTVPDVIELTQKLIQVDTTAATTNERMVLEDIASMFEKHGFTCTFSQYDPESPAKCSLIAESNPKATGEALCLGGHIDVVPFGSTPWKVEPLSGEVKDGILYGRGSTDMKGGMAAMICAAINMAHKLNGANLVVHVYGGEELGLLGSRHLAVNQPETLDKIGAVVVGEPTGLQVQAGHKGVLWIRLFTSGTTAHASMPDVGDNALAKILPTANRLKDYDPQVSHPYLGKSTAVLSRLHSGLNTNSVPDGAVMDMDVRTVAGQTNESVLEQVRALADSEVTIEAAADIPPLWTDPEHPWCVRVNNIVQAATTHGKGIGTAVFATDGSALRLCLKEAPILVLGPGAQNMAHQVDEHVAVEELRAAQLIYENIIKDWYGIA